MVVSGMAMHLVTDLDHVSRLVFSWLKPGGSFLFTQRHPIRTANPEGDETETMPPSWAVSSYFQVGRRTYQWLGSEVEYYHRTISDIVSAVTGAGFELVEVDEPVPVCHEETKRTMENRSSPAVLLVHGTKPLS
jgi:hypothetical protein